MANISEQKSEAQMAYEDIKSRYLQMQSSIKKHFPKVDSRLVRELLMHSANASDGTRLFSLEVLAKEGTNPEKARDYFLSKTGKVPSSYEHGTHYLVNVLLTFELLRDIQSYPEVEYITGSYVGVTSAVSQIHYHRGADEQSRMVDD